ncbi:MAG: hypothetical protein IJJ33_00410 [Victivallales bacterium]|nr:hypothetical protein [Victivallales bacterium]
MSELSQDEARAELRERLHNLETLNPDLTKAERERLLELAGQVGREFFSTASAQATVLADAYMNSAVKRAGAAIMRDYFQQLENGARLLESQGEVKLLATNATPGTFTTALVPRESREPLDFCKILNRTSIPKGLVKAADAFRRRNVVVSTVFEHALRVMLAIDEEATLEWLVRFYQERQGDLDPDLVRDSLLVCLECRSPLSPAFLKWLLRFCADQNLLEYWPTVTRLADQLLCRVSLRRWFDQHKPRSTSVASLRLLIQSASWDEGRILEWEKRALASLGCSVERYMSLDGQELSSAWRAASLVSELHRIGELYWPTMLAASHILVLPDGTEQLAMAFLGLAGEALEKWEAKVGQFAVKVVNRTFLLDSRAGRCARDTIRRLSFGNESAYQLATTELDLVSGEFESIRQREKVSRFLGVFYASYRRTQLLGAEVARRYRNLMRLMHPDFLAQVLSPAQLSDIQASGVLTEIATIASEARRYLARRRATDNTLEQMMAAKINFERFVREKRLTLVRQAEP